MTLKKFVLCNLPQGADFGVVPGGKITRDNMKFQEGEINVSNDKGLEI